MSKDSHLTAKVFGFELLVGTSIPSNWCCSRMWGVKTSGHWYVSVVERNLWLEVVKSWWSEFMVCNLLSYHTSSTLYISLVTFSHLLNHVLLDGQNQPDTWKYMPPPCWIPLSCPVQTVPAHFSASFLMDMKSQTCSRANFAPKLACTQFTEEENKKF